MPGKDRRRPNYDVPTAVTFLLGGVALGSVLTLLFSPRRADESSDGRRSDGRRLDAIRSEGTGVRPAETQGQKYSVAISGTPQNVAQV
jgi:hypothetical protein